MTIVRDLAHARAGDKGDRLNVVVVANSPAEYQRLAETLSAERVQERFAHLGATSVKRYEVPSVRSLNFVIDEVLDGGVTTSLRVDTHGKSLSYLLLGMEVE